MQDAPEIDARQLRNLSGADLEQLYATDWPLTLPQSGDYEGRYLHGVRDDGAVVWPLRRALQLMFELPPWQVHITGSGGHWSFFDPLLAAGALRMSVGPSRWRATKTVQLTYDESHLPAPIRWLLYDELKPISPGLCLGLGGINHWRSGVGAMFFFALERR